MLSLNFSKKTQRLVIISIYIDYVISITENIGKGGPAVRVAVCCKGIPIGLNLESVHIAEGDIKSQGTDLYINEFDAYALEVALDLKESYGAETFALSLGPLRSQEVLYFSLAKGVDQALRVDGETNRPELAAGSLVQILKEIEPQIILTGVQSTDWGGGEVGVYLSQALNMSLAYAVVEISQISDTSIRIKKELGGGKIAEVALKLPVVLCIQSGIKPLQYVSAVKRKKARKIQIKPGGKLNLKDMEQSISGLMSYEFKEVTLTPREGQAEMLIGTRTEMAVKLLQIINESV